jgi:DNA polymerase-3 subunit alpha
VGAYLTEIKPIRTKKGEMMAFLTASDATGDVEGVIFPAVYRLHSAICQQGSVVLLKGHVEERNGKLQFIVQKLEEAESIKNLEMTKEKLYIRVPKDHHDTEMLKEINAILKKYKGNTPVILYYEDRNQTLQLSEKDWIQPEANFLDELKALLGVSNVILK